MTLNLDRYFDFARQVAWEAGRMTLGYFQTGIRPEWKEDDSPVTVADRNTELFIRHQIEAAFPSHHILGEEFGGQEVGVGEADFQWIVDPIDGTKSFVKGVPLYGVLLALLIEGVPLVGVANFPALNEMIAAANRLGCWWNGRRAAVSQTKTLAESVICHIDTASFARHGRGSHWQKLQQASYYNAGWCDAYGYLLVASGRAEVALDPIMNPWDCAPFLPILQEAGGYFGDWRGHPTIDAGEALATNGHLLDELLRYTAADLDDLS